jgi:hypothetical protein
MILGVAAIVGAGFPWLSYFRRPCIRAYDADQTVIFSRIGERISTTFSISNVGMRDLTVTDVEARVPCCSSVISRPSILRRNEVGTVKVSVAPDEYGRMTVEFVVHSNDPVNPVKNLTVTTMPEKKPPYFRYNPAWTIDFGDCWKAGASRELVVQTVESKSDPNWVEWLSTNDAWLEVENERPTELVKEGTDYLLRRYRYKVTIGQLQNFGNLESSLNIHTTGGTTRVPVKVKFVPAVRLIPTTIVFDDDNREYFVHAFGRGDESAPLVSLGDEVPDWLEITQQSPPAESLGRWHLKLRQTPSDTEKLLRFRVAGGEEAEVALRILCVSNAKNGIVDSSDH